MENPQEKPLHTPLHVRFVYSKEAAPSWCGVHVRFVWK